MKSWESIIEQGLRQGSYITENQFDFISGRSTMEAIYLHMKRCLEKGTLKSYRKERCLSCLHSSNERQTTM
ncbi:hypothetical protein Lal_00012275 [Lupinus albus]|nr:hypothetical protein Lal_00012275 [Lupinus albus]